MTTLPDPVELYPDVVKLGSLAAALQKVATEHGLDLGTVETSERDPFGWAGVESTTPKRRALGINAAPKERAWCPIGWGMGIELIRGNWVDDLIQVARLAHEWRAGTPVVEIRAALPWVKVTRQGEVAEQGPAAVVEVQWQSMFQEAAGPGGWPQQMALIEAAYNQPVLRQLYPYTSMWTLRFSTTTGFRFSPDMVSIQAPRGDGPYRLTTSWSGPVIAEAATAEQAIALAVSFIPDHTGPAIEGPYPS